jgi:hypothetical protein
VARIQLNSIYILSFFVDITISLVYLCDEVDAVKGSAPMIRPPSGLP